MPYIIVRTLYPSGKIDEVAKKYLEITEKFPPDETMGKVVVPVAVAITTDGVEAMGISEIERDKLADALDYTSKIMLEYRNIEGYKYEIKTWATVDEAFELLGLG